MDLSQLASDSFNALFVTTEIYINICSNYFLHLEMKFTARNLSFISTVTFLLSEVGDFDFPAKIIYFIFDKKSANQPWLQQMHKFPILSEIHSTPSQKKTYPVPPPNHEKKTFLILLNVEHSLNQDLWILFFFWISQAFFFFFFSSLHFWDMNSI